MPELVNDYVKFFDETPHDDNVDEHKCYCVGWCNVDHRVKIEMARDAIELKCVSLEDEGINIPQPSDIANLNANKGTFVEEGKTVVSLVDVDSTEYRRKIDTKTVRRNVALPSWLNYEAERAGINVSRVLQEALMSTLNLERRV